MRQDEKRSLAAWVSFRPNTNSLATNADISLAPPLLLLHPNPIVRSHVWYNTYVHARTHARPNAGASSPAFNPLAPGRIFMRITHAASRISARPEGCGEDCRRRKGCVAHFKRKIFSRFWLMASRARGAGSRRATCTRGPLATPKACKNLPLDPHACTSFA